MNWIKIKLISFTVRRVCGVRAPARKWRRLDFGNCTIFHPDSGVGRRRANQLKNEATLMKRREFIRKTITLGAMAGLPGWYAEEALDAAESAVPTSPNDKPNIALIGCGGQG